MSLTDAQRAYIDARSKRDGDHILWTGTIDHCGYAAGTIDGRTQVISRVMLCDHLGRSLRPGHFACHKPIICRHRHCINPAHLYEGTREQNMADKRKDGTSGIGVPTHVKLTPASVAAIRADERPRKQIAEQYGITQDTVFDVLARRSWAKV